MDKLLLFDDSEKNVDTILDPLAEDGGFDVTWVKNVEELNDVIQPDIFKVIVTDVSIQNSPERGYELVNRIRTKHKIFSIPVVVYSANVTMDGIKKENKELFFDYVSKEEKDWVSQLIKACKKAVIAPGINVGLNTMRKMAIDARKIMNIVDLSNFPELEMLGIAQSFPDGKTTIENLIKTLEEEKNDDIMWENLEKVLVAVFKSEGLF